MNPSGPSPYAVAALRGRGFPARIGTKRRQMLRSNDFRPLGTLIRITMNRL
jgi:hypothetical protein